MKITLAFKSEFYVVISCLNAVVKIFIFTNFINFLGDIFKIFCKLWEFSKFLKLVYIIIFFFILHIFVMCEIYDISIKIFSLFIVMKYWNCHKLLSIFDVKFCLKLIFLSSIRGRKKVAYFVMSLVLNKFLFYDLNRLIIKFFVLDI